MSSAAELARGVALFNAGDAAGAARIFERLAAGTGRDAENAALFLRHAREALSRAPEEPPEPAVPEEAVRALAAAAQSADAAMLAKAGRRLFDAHPPAAFRLWRDLWLSGAARPRAKPARSPWAAALDSSLEWKAGRDLAALELLAVSARSAETGWARFFAAEILLRRLDLYGEAAAQARRAARDCPWLWQARFLEAEARWSRGEDAAAAFARLEKVRAPASSRPSMLAWRGALLVWAGRAEEALPSLDAACAAGSHNARCWRGAARVLLGRPAEALADLDAVLAADPGDDEALVWRAEAKGASGRADLDLACSRGALWGFALRARLAFAEGRADEGLADFARLLPPVYLDAPDAGTHDPGRRAPAEAGVEPSRARALTEEALRAAGGVRRSDAHLNRAWMAAAGARPAARPAPDERLGAWLKSKGVECRLPAPRDPAEAARARKILARA